MRKIGLYLGLIALAGGCTTSAPDTAEVGTPPLLALDAQRIDAIRQNIRRTDAQARVGRVVAVVAEQRLAAVADLESHGLQPGSQITFINAQQDVIAFGEVLRVLPDVVHVRYRAEGAGRRAPTLGDLGVWFSAARTSALGS